MEQNDWKVYFNHGFRPDLQKVSGEPGKKVTMAHCFQWDGQEWYIPAVYVCDEGLVIDLFERVEFDVIEAFQERWATIDLNNLSLQAKKQYSLENPLGGQPKYRPRLFMNGAESARLEMFSKAWTPFGSLNKNQPEEDVAWKVDVLLREGCDLDAAWVMRRLSFVWPGGSKPHLTSATLVLDRDIDVVDGPQFRITKAGEQFSFEHPATGMTHTLTALDYKHEIIPEENRIQMGFLLPHHYAELEYEITPPLTNDMYGIHDCAQGDKMQEVVEGDLFEKMAQCRGSGTWMKNDRVKSQQRGVDVVTSSTYFNPVDIVQWGFVFALPVCEDAEIEINFPCNEYQC